MNKYVKSLQSNRQVSFSWPMMVTWIVVLGGAILLAQAGGSPLPMPLVLAAGWTMNSAAMVPMRLAIRLQASLGVLASVGFVLGAVSFGYWWSGVIMAVLLFALTLTTQVAAVGGPLSTIPVIAYLIGAAGIAKGMTISEIVMDVAIGTLIGIVFCFATKLADGHRQARLAVAAAWKPGSPQSQRVAAARVLYLEGQPAGLVTLLRDSARTYLGLSFVNHDAKYAGLADAAATQAAAISTALEPAGPLAPRNVPNWTASYGDTAAIGDGGARVVTEALTDATATLRGEITPSVGRRYGDPLWRQFIHCWLEPDPTTLRWAIKRAVVIGVLTVFVATSGQNENVIWILAATMVILTPAAVPIQAMKRFTGTVAGVMLAALLSLVVPNAILFPYLAVVIFGVGLAYFYRNYVFFAAGLAFFVAFAVGIPAQNVPLWAGLRALDTLIGAIFALVVSEMIFPNRANLGIRSARAESALLSLADSLSPTRSQPDEEQLRKSIARAEVEVDSMAAELASGVKGTEQPEYAAAANRYRDCLDHLRLVAIIRKDQTNSSLVPSALAGVRSRLAATGATSR